MEAIKHKKAQMLYDVIDSSRIFTCAVEPGSRSDMNVVSRTGSDELDAKFVQESVTAYHQPEGPPLRGRHAGKHL